jgi:hypothetical protein
MKPIIGILLIRKQEKNRLNLEKIQNGVFSRLIHRVKH